VTEWIDSSGVQILESAGHVHYDPHLWQDPDRVKRLITDYDALVVRNQTRVTSSLLEQSHLRVIGRLGVGLDNIDVAAANASQIPVVAAKGANGIAVAEYVLACCLQQCRHLTDVDAITRNGQWDRMRGGVEIYGKTLGIIGLGDIGQRLALRARALGMHVMAYDPVLLPTHWTIMDLGVEIKTLEEVLAFSDFVSIHVPLTADTYHLINASRLKQMQPSGYLINTARGGVVDEAALLQTIQSGHLAGAALDVREVEPPPPDDVLRHEPRILLTPHISGLTQEAQVRTAHLVAEDVVRVLHGVPPVAAI
jgi:D-3-phosphoglycerate dehydrogenase